MANKLVANKVETGILYVRAMPVDILEWLDRRAVKIAGGRRPPRRSDAICEIVTAARKAERVA